MTVDIAISHGLDMKINLKSKCLLLINAPLTSLIGVREGDNSKSLLTSDFEIG